MLLTDAIALINGAIDMLTNSAAVATDAGSARSDRNLARLLRRESDEMAASAVYRYGWLEQARIDADDAAWVRRMLTIAGVRQ